MVKQTKNKEKIFSVELKSRENLKNVNLNNGCQESVLIEGSLGKLENACFVEDVLLEIVGQKGVMRINLQENEITKKETTGHKVKTK